MAKLFYKFLILIFTFNLSILIASKENKDINEIEIPKENIKLTGSTIAMDPANPILMGEYPNGYSVWIDVLKNNPIPMSGYILNNKTKGQRYLTRQEAEKLGVELYYQALKKLKEKKQ